MSNIVWHSGSIDRDKREKNLGQKAKLLWFTGLSGSGKSTVANALEEKLYERGNHTYLLDGDNLRFGLNGDLGFRIEDRAENVRRVAEVGKLFVDSGAITLCTFVSPTEEMRSSVRKIIGLDFIEVYVKCDIEVCVERDPKGLYKKALAGDIENFTGIDSPYEAPKSPELVIETDKYSLEESVQQLMDYLEKREVI